MGDFLLRGRNAGCHGPGFSEERERSRWRHHLYDPDRARTVTTGCAIKTIDDFWEAPNVAIDPLRSNGGAAFRILTEPISSPEPLNCHRS
jgi:hypothetical protein